jgi:hypothetical protein
LMPLLSPRPKLVNYSQLSLSHQPRLDPFPFLNCCSWFPISIIIIIINLLIYWYNSLIYYSTTTFFSTTIELGKSVLGWTTRNVAPWFSWTHQTLKIHRKHFLKKIFKHVTYDYISLNFLVKNTNLEHELKILLGIVFPKVIWKSFYF